MALLGRPVRHFLLLSRYPGAIVDLGAVVASTEGFGDHLPAGAGGKLNRIEALPRPESARGLLPFGSMVCSGCGYENPVDLARCPRCHRSEETIAAREALPAGDLPEVRTQVNVEAQLDLVTGAGHLAPVVAKRERFTSRRTPSLGRALVSLAGAAVAFTVGIALSSRSTTPTHTRPAPVVHVAPATLAVVARPAASLPALPVTRSTPRGTVQVPHTRQGNTGVPIGAPVSITRLGSAEVVGTLVAARDGYIDVATRRGMVRLHESDVVDATTN